MRILALDCSSAVGWSVFDSPVAMPRVGTWYLPTKWPLHDYGHRYADLHEWLTGFVALVNPRVLAFEAPLAPWGHLLEERSSAHVFRLLNGIVSVVELVAVQRNVRCFEVSVADAKMVLAGHGRATKIEMKTAAVKRGFRVADDHQADACAVALTAYEHLGVVE